MGVRFALDERQAVVMFVDVPELKFHNLGPIHVKQKDGGYQAYQFSFRPGPDNRALSGLWSFDGHDVPFELVPGELQAPPARVAEAGRMPGQFGRSRHKARSGLPPHRSTTRSMSAATMAACTR